MWDYTINGIDFYHIINWFYIYSFLGWLWETCFVSVRKGKLVNRGFVNGPLCTIYGVGALTVYVILKPVENHIIILYFGGMALATFIEYITAFLMEGIFRTSWWDYSDKPLNFQGRICLQVSLGWGLFAVGLFKILHPVVGQMVEWYPVTAGKIGVCVVTVVYAADFCSSAITAIHLHERIPVWEQAIDQLQEELLFKVHEKMHYFEKAKGFSMDAFERAREFSADKFGKAKELSADKFGRAREFSADKLEWARELSADKLERARMISSDKLEKAKEHPSLKELELKREALMEELSRELQKRKEAMAGMTSHNALRFVKSYPNLNRGYRLRREKKGKKQSEK